MNISGIGVICARGRGVDCFEYALKQGWQKPSELNIRSLENQTNLVYQVDSDTIKDKKLLKKVRRSDKFSKMAVLAAADALNDSAIENIDKKRLGVIVATAFGPHVTTFDFLDGLLDYGDINVSPITFSNSVHNAAASYITEVLNVHGPCLTITQFQFSFQYALQMAKSWLDEKRCDYCLVGAVDQFGDVLGYIQNQKLTLAPDGKIKPFHFKPTCQVPGEGAVFFFINKENSENDYCEIEEISFCSSGKYKKTIDLNIIDADGMMVDESVYLASILLDIPTAAYAPLFGSMMIGSAFNCAAGALMIKNQIYYPNPVTDNPHNINLLQSEQSSNIDLISCTKYDCNEDFYTILLKRGNHSP
jgi:3-oxoacyl-[acyl-carrier-protein] synthase II